MYKGLHEALIGKLQYVIKRSYSLCLVVTVISIADVNELHRRGVPAFPAVLF